MFHKKLFFCFLIICSSAYQINAQQKTFNKIKTYLNKKLNGISETITPTKKPSSSIPLVSAITKSIFNHPVDSLFYVCDIPLPASVTVASFYRKTYYKVVWVNDNGFNTQGLQFLIALSQADNNGLNASDYHLLQLNKLESKFSKNRLKQKEEIVKNHNSTHTGGSKKDFTTPHSTNCLQHSKKLFRNHQCRLSVTQCWKLLRHEE